MLKYLKKYWFWCILAPLCMVGEITMDLLQPDMMADIVDNGVLAGNMEVVLRVGIRMILLVMLGAICGILCGVFTNLASQQFGNDLRKDLFSRIVDLSFQQTDKISTGSLVTRLTNDVNQVQTMVSMLMRGVVRSGFMFLGGILMLYRQAPQFAIVVACVLPVIIVLASFFLLKTGPMFGQMQEKLDGVNNVMQENVAGARVVKAYVREDYEISRFGKANNALCSIYLKIFKLLAFMAPLMTLVLNLCVVTVLLISGVQIRGGSNITPGEIIAAITYVTMILQSILFLAMMFQNIVRARASIGRIKEVLEQDSALSGGKRTVGEDTPVVAELKGVSFAYPNTGEPVLEGVDLVVRRGETLAILGATGSGKSSLVNLIPRFYDPTEGKVLFHGVDVREYDLAALRGKIGIVLQKAELYTRSIADNIRWGKDDATPWEIKAAAEIAQADDFICAAPYGYETFVTEGGHSLSGGQKQRISISRAVLKQADLLIFDDATSALDLKTEAKFYDALHEARPDAAKIIIAQRIASVRSADRIAVLEGGKITACADHETLMQTSETYRDIYHSQLKEEEDQ